MKIQDLNYFGFKEAYKGETATDYKNKTYSSFLFEIGLYEIVVTPLSMMLSTSEPKFHFIVRYDDFTHFSSFGYKKKATYAEIVALLEYLNALENHEIYPYKDELYYPFYKEYAKRY